LILVSVHHGVDPLAIQYAKQDIGVPDVLGQLRFPGPVNRVAVIMGRIVRPMDTVEEAAVIVEVGEPEQIYLRPVFHDVALYGEVDCPGDSVGRKRPFSGLGHLD
jgi:hypothetical protein